MADQNDSFYIDKTLYSGRPLNPSGRLPKELRTYDLLDDLNISFVRLDHSPLPTIEACQEVDAILETNVCKNLFLCNAQKTNFYLLLLPGNKKFRTAVVSKQIGTARLSFAETEFMEEFLDITPGSVSVLGLLNDKEKRVHLLIDREVLDHEYFACHPCINTSSLKFKTSDLFDKIIPAMSCRYTLVDLP